jgi:beta-lactamase superfamily II metal-dependent hydrolase
MATKTAKKTVRKTARKAPAKPAAAKRGPKANAFQHRARVRMYRVGLGDCFLVTSYQEDKPRHMLIDCGMFAGSRLNPAIAEKDVQAQVVKDIAAETGGNLDVVVVTHEHMDHVSIFNSAKSIFDGMTFGQAWFGWVEDPDNKLAKSLRGKYERLKVALAAGLSGLQGLAEADPDAYGNVHQGTAKIAEFLGLAADGKKLAVQPRAAMDYVKAKAGKANLKFGHPGDTWGFGGLKVRVLGPPESEEQMRIMERAGASYDRALLFGVDDEADAPAEAQYPFPAQWRLDAVIQKGQVQLDKPADSSLLDMVARYSDAQQSWRRIDNQALDSISTLALQMDKYINNTSLALAFEFDDDGKGDVLLFPGDAQVGNWSSWFDIKKFDVSDLLSRTTFYKVGHHGSHNATYKPALEKMNHPKLVAMIPTNQKFAKNSKKWVMPAPNLNKALKEHTHERLLRNDQGIGGVADPMQSGEWNGLLKNVEVEPLFIDYYV